MFSLRALQLRESCRFRNDSETMRPVLRAKIAPALADRGENLRAGTLAPRAARASCLRLRTPRPSRRCRVCGGRGNARWFRSAFQPADVVQQQSVTFTEHVYIGIRIIGESRTRNEDGKRGPNHGQSVRCIPCMIWKLIPARAGNLPCFPSEQRRHYIGGFRTPAGYILKDCG